MASLFLLRRARRQILYNRNQPARRANFLSFSLNFVLSVSQGLPRGSTTKKRTHATIKLIDTSHKWDGDALRLTPV